MAYQRITKESLLERWNKVMKSIGHDHFCIPNTENKITCYRDMVYYAEIIYEGFDNDLRDGYDDKSQFYQEKGKAKRLRDWLINAPIDNEVRTIKF